MRKNMFSSGMRSRRGFTLVETLLSVAILVVLALMMYQGFLFTMRLSSDTAQYQLSAKDANTEANLALADDTTLTPSNGVVVFHLPTTTANLNVNVYRVTPATPSILDPNDTTGLNTAYRFSFTDRP